MIALYELLKEINSRPKPFEVYTADKLWTNEYTSEQMLQYHLNGEVDVSSRKFSFIDKSTQWIIECFNINKESSIADFGCGPGLYTTRLARSGAQVTGIDFSERSLTYAKKVAEDEGLTVDYCHQDYLTYKSEKRFDLIIMIMCDFCVLSPKQREKLLWIFKEHLKPKGKILFDVYTYQAFDNREELTFFEKNLLNNFWSADDYFGFLNVFKYNIEKVIVDKYTIFEPERTKTIYNWLQYYNEEAIRDLFKSNGFKIQSILGDVAGRAFDPNGEEMAIIAEKI